MKINEKYIRRLKEVIIDVVIERGIVDLYKKRTIKNKYNLYDY